jgi:hypothetical protein
MAPDYLIIVLGVPALAGLFWWYRRSRVNDGFNLILTRHRPTAKVSSRAELVDGRNHIPVALTLEQQHIYYQNSDLDATLDIDQIDEVEYSSDLLTGGIATGAVLRLRAHGRAIEFVLDMATARRWSELLPPHRMDQIGTVHAV